MHAREIEQRLPGDHADTSQARHPPPPERRSRPARRCAAAESSRAATSLSSATVTRVLRATCISRSKLGLADDRKRDQQIVRLAPRASPRPPKPSRLSVPRRPIRAAAARCAVDLCVLVCGRSRSPCAFAYSATRQRLRSMMSRSTTSAGVSISETCMHTGYDGALHPDPPLSKPHPPHSPTATERRPHGLYNAR